MTSNAQDFIDRSRQWLSEEVFPLWTANGIDSKNGGFEEGLSDSGEPVMAERRALVQARQIYSYTEALKMKILPVQQVQKIVNQAVQFLLKYYSLPTGAFIHTVNNNGEPQSRQSELYTQAFVIFGLARAFEILKNQELKDTALRLLAYLDRERKNPAGGYTEIKDGKSVFQSNPHMHLFEALLEWVRIDADSVWTSKASEIFQLCQLKFIQKDTSLIAEYFDENWNVLKEGQRYVFEPGHQYEWAWLMIQYQILTKNSVGAVPQTLFNLAERHGVHPETGFVFDEVYSDFTVKKASSRFWPQCERIKAAVEIGQMLSNAEMEKCLNNADQAMDVLFQYFTKPLKGLWQDTRLENGEFNQQSSKASSLYHIINAMSEYELKRLRLKQAE